MHSPICPAAGHALICLSVLQQAMRPWFLLPHFLLSWWHPTLTSSSWPHWLTALGPQYITSITSWAKLV